MGEGEFKSQDLNFKAMVVRAQTQTAPNSKTYREEGTVLTHLFHSLSQEDERQLPPAHLLGMLYFEAAA